MCTQKKTAAVNRLKRYWTRWDGGKQKVATVTNGNVDEVKQSKARLEVKASEKRKKLSDVKEDDENAVDTSASQLLSPPTAAAGIVRGRSPVPSSTSPSVSPSLSPAAPRSRSPSPLPAADVIRSPSPLPALSTTSLPLPNLSGVYILDTARSQSISPLLARHHIRVRKSTGSTAAYLRQSKQGMKPSPLPLLPVTPCEVVRLSCKQSTVTTAYYVCKQWANQPLSSYPTSCFVLVATDHFTADGIKRVVYSELHPRVEARCVVKEGAVVLVEAEGEVSGGGRWRETSELKRTTDGLELCITRLEAGQKPLVVRRFYRLTSDLALPSGEAAVVDDKLDDSHVPRKQSIEHDSRVIEDERITTKAEIGEADGEKEEATTEVEPMQPIGEDDNEPESTELEQVREEESEEEEAEDEDERQQTAESTQAIDQQLNAGSAVLASAEQQAEVEPIPEDEEGEDDDDAANQSMNTSTQPQRVVAPSMVEREEKVEDPEEEAEDVTRGVRSARHADGEQGVAKLQQSLWSRKDVWLAAVLAVILLIMWNATRADTQ